MKKLLIIATVTTVLAGASAFGQGFFTFTSGPTYIWNDFTGPNPYRANTVGPVDTAFLLNYTGTGTALAGASTPTNGYPAKLPQTTWANIINDPNYGFATNASGGTLIIGSTTAAGGMTGAAANVTDVGVLGTSANGGVINAYAIAWDATYANPYLAAAANAAVGWSPVVAYAYQSSSVNPTAWGTQYAAAGGYAFGVMAINVPEPATFALTGLGAAAMLIFRRRK